MTAPSYAHGASDLPLLGSTIGERLRATVEQFGDREALVVRDQDCRTTYSELWEISGEAARGLLSHGVGKGDRVGIWAPNRHEWVVTQYATARIGAILVNVNPAYRRSELEYALTRSGISVLLLARGFRDADYVEMLDDVRARCPSLREAIVLEEGWLALLADGDGVSADELAAREARQVLAPLVLIAIGVNRIHHERALHAHHRAEARVDAFDLARDEAISDIACAGAAEFLRQRHPEQALLAHQPDELRVGLLLEIGLSDAGREFVSGEVARRVADHSLVLGELRLDEQRIVPLEGAEIGSVKGAH